MKKQILNDNLAVAIDNLIHNVGSPDIRRYISNIENSNEALEMRLEDLELEIEICTKEWEQGARDTLQATNDLREYRRKAYVKSYYWAFAIVCAVTVGIFLAILP